MEEQRRIREAALQALREALGHARPALKVMQRLVKAPLKELVPYLALSPKEVRASVAQATSKNLHEQAINLGVSREELSSLTPQAVEALFVVACEYQMGEMGEMSEVRTNRQETEQREVSLRDVRTTPGTGVATSPALNSQQSRSTAPETEKKPDKELLANGGDIGAELSGSVDAGNASAGNADVSTKSVDTKTNGEASNSRDEPALARPAHIIRGALTQEQGAPTAQVVSANSAESNVGSATAAPNSKEQITDPVTGALSAPEPLNAEQLQAIEDSLPPASASEMQGEERVHLEPKLARHAVAAQQPGPVRDLEPGTPLQLNLSELEWPDRSNPEARDYDLMRRYLRLYFSDLRRKKRLTPTLNDQGESHPSALRLIKSPEKTKKSVLVRLWEKFEEPTRTFLRTSPEALGNSSGKADERPLSRSQELILSRMRALRTRLNTASIREILSEVVDRDTALQLAEGHDLPPLSAEVEQAINTLLRNRSRGDELHYQRVKSVSERMQRLLRQTPMSQAALIELLAQHGQRVSEQELRSALRMNLSPEPLISQLEEGLGRITEDDINRVRNECFERVKDSTMPNAVGRAWVTEAREEQRRALKANSEATRKALDELGMTRVAEQINRGQDVLNQNLVMTPGEAQRMIEAMRRISDS